MLAFLTSLRAKASLTEGWAMLYREDYDNDDVMHPEVLVDIDIG